MEKTGLGVERMTLNGENGTLRRVVGEIHTSHHKMHGLSRSSGAFIPMSQYFEKDPKAWPSESGKDPFR